MYACILLQFLSLPLLIFTINEIKIADVIIGGIKFIEIPSTRDKHRTAKEFAAESLRSFRRAFLIKERSVCNDII